MIEQWSIGRIERVIISRLTANIGRLYVARGRTTIKGLPGSNSTRAVKAIRMMLGGLLHSVITRLARRGKSMLAYLMGIIAGMRLSLDMMPMPVVTDEQMNALAVLKMRSKVTQAELTQAARAVADNPVALGVVYEVAEQNGFSNLRGVIGGESIDSARKCVEKLTASARELLALNKADARKERGINAMRDINNGGSGIPALRGFSVDRDVSDVNEAMYVFGGVGDVGSFAEFVNRQPGT